MSHRYPSLSILIPVPQRPGMSLPLTRVPPSWTACGFWQWPMRVEGQGASADQLLLLSQLCAGSTVSSFSPEKPVRSHSWSTAQQTSWRHRWSRSAGIHPSTAEFLGSCKAWFQVRGLPFAALIGRWYQFHGCVSSWRPLNFAGITFWWSASSCQYWRGVLPPLGRFLCGPSSLNRLNVLETIPLRPTSKRTLSHWRFSWRRSSEIASRLFWNSESGKNLSVTNLR